MINITGIVLTLNEADRIRECLRSMRTVCDEVIALDAGSSDDTVKIATGLGAKVVTHPWKGFAHQRRRALDLAANEWVLMLDADERLDPRAQHAIADWKRSGPPAHLLAYEFRFQTWFLGRRLRFGAAGRERHVRLFRRELGFADRPVHERVAVERARRGLLTGNVLHLCARNFAHRREKLNLYASLFAKERSSRRCTLRDVLLRPAWNWFQNMILRGGLLDGTVGLIYHQQLANYTFDKYAEAWSLRPVSQQNVAARSHIGTQRPPIPEQSGGGYAVDHGQVRGPR